MSQKKQKYQDNYLDFGFTSLIKDDLQIPQCVVCVKTFSNSTMKPASKLECFGALTKHYLFTALFIHSIKFSPKITCHKRRKSTRTIIWILDLHLLLRMIFKFLSVLCA